MKSFYYYQGPDEFLLKGEKEKKNILLQEQNATGLM